MSGGESLLDDLAGAVLDGAAVDWAVTESDADETARPLVRELRLVASVAQLHRFVLRPARAASPPTHATAAPGHWGHLRLLDMIGHGTFGEVFRAWDTRLDREVALKLIPATAPSVAHSERTIIREGRLLARVRHPNVVTIYGAEQIGDRIGLWMEFVRGRTLEQLLKDGEEFPAADIIRIGKELCRAVSAVHAAGLLHRDIKAHNVMRADDGRIVLMDFGAGTELEGSDSPDIAGTPLYAAPEILSDQPATVRSDVYSLGILLYHLVSAAYPVKGRSMADVRQAHERGDRVPLRSVRPDVQLRLARVIERACDPHPGRRYESADAFARELSTVERPWRTSRARSYVAAAAVILIAVPLLSALRTRDGGGSATPGSSAGLLPGEVRPVERRDIIISPFENIGDSDSGLLVDMLSVRMIRQFGNIDGLTVQREETSFRLRDEPRDLDALGRRLGVNLMVEGRARFSEGRLLVHAALVTVPEGTSRWSNTFEGEVGADSDIAALIDDLTRAIVDELRLELGPTQRRYDTDVPTLMKYMRARTLRDGRGNWAKQAIALFEEVITTDAEYAPALAALASTLGYLGIFYPDVAGTYVHPQEAISRLVPLASRALQLDPSLAEAHAALGFAHALDLRWDAADASFREAIKLEHTRTTLYGDYVLAVLLPSGRLDEARAVLEGALQRDTMSLDLRRVLARVQINAGLYGEALQNCVYVMERDPSFPMVEQFAAWARLFSGEGADRAEAIAWFERYARGDDGRPGTDDDRPGVTGWLHAIHNRRAEAEAIAALPRFEQLPQRRAEIYGLLGDRRKALEALEQLAGMNPHRAAYHLSGPELLVLRGDPDAAEFRRRVLALDR